MSNKSGFTLVEILAVIIILGLLMTIAIPSVNKVSTQVKQKMLNTKAKLAEENLLLWASDNKKCFIGSGSNCLTMTCSGTATRTCNVTYGNMAAYGLIDYDEGTNVINPVDKSSINNKKITIKYNTTNKSFEITNNEVGS